MKIVSEHQEKGKGKRKRKIKGEKKKKIIKQADGFS